MFIIRYKNNLDFLSVFGWIMSVRNRHHNAFASLLLVLSLLGYSNVASAQVCAGGPGDVGTWVDAAAVPTNLLPSGELQGVFDENGNEIGTFNFNADTIPEAVVLEFELYADGELMDDGGPISYQLPISEWEMLEGSPLGFADIFDIGGSTKPYDSTYCFQVRAYNATEEYSDWASSDFTVKEAWKETSACLVDEDPNIVPGDWLGAAPPLSIDYPLNNEVIIDVSRSPEVTFPDNSTLYDVAYSFPSNNLLGVLKSDDEVLPMPEEPIFGMASALFGPGTEMCLKIRASNGADEHTDWQYTRVVIGEKLADGCNAEWGDCNNDCSINFDMNQVDEGGVNIEHLDVCEYNGNHYLKDVARQSRHFNTSHDGILHQGNMDSDSDEHASIFTSMSTHRAPDNTTTAFPSAPQVSNLTEIEGLSPSSAEILSGAHNNTAMVYDFLQDVLGLNGIDNAGGAMGSVVEVENPSFVAFLGCVNWFTGDATMNAFYTDLYGRAFYCSKVQADYDKSFAHSLDVVAHEWGHALEDQTYNSSEYVRESGAIMEAFSDWLGVAVEQWATGNENFTLAENTVDGGIRDIQNPMLHSQPAAYGENFIYFRDTKDCQSNILNDNCYVHTNSGVGNKFFYLLAFGDEEFRGYDFNGFGVGVEKAMQISSDMYMSLGSGEFDYVDARRAMEDSVAGTAYELLVKRAWDAVAVDVPLFDFNTSVYLDSDCVGENQTPGQLHVVLEPTNEEDASLTYKGYVDSIHSSPYADHDVIKLVATENANFEFVRFIDQEGHRVGEEGNPIHTFRLFWGSPSAVTAVFRKSQRHEVTVVSVDQNNSVIDGNIVISGAGSHESCIVNPETMTFTIDSQQSGFEFVEWTGLEAATNVVLTPNSITFNLVADVDVDAIAHFVDHNTLLNGNFDDNLDNWIQDRGSNAYVRSSSPASYNGAGYYAGKDREGWFGGDDDTRSYQVVDVSSHAATIDSGTQTFNLSAQLASQRVHYSDGWFHHRAILSAWFFDDTEGAGNQLGTWRSGNIKTNGAWQQVSQDLAIPLNTRSIRINIIGEVPAGHSGEIRGFFDNVRLIPVE